jgi:hypothetical protein
MDGAALRASKAAHQGHADPLSFLLGLAILWVFVRGVWALAWSGG